LAASLYDQDALEPTTRRAQLWGPSRAGEAGDAVPVDSVRLRAREEAPEGEPNAERRACERTAVEPARGVAAPRA